MTLVLRYAARTDVGRGPKQLNEDSGFAAPLMLAVADGMGGMVAGDMASALTIDTLGRLDPAGLDDPLDALRGVAREANERIARYIRSDPRTEGMGTTLTAGIVAGEQLALAHIGDSRAYLLRAERLEQITHDHTFVQSLVDDGRLTPAEAAHHPHKALITRALQGGAESAPDLTQIELQAGDRLLFCSDGLDNADLDDAAIAELLITSATAAEAADALIDAALDRGSPDNVTCVVADVVEVADGEAGGEVGGASARPATAPSLVGAAAELDELDEGPSEVTMTRENLLEADDAYDGDIDDEELRYAPQPPKRFRWLRRTALAVVILGIVGTGLWAAYTWTQAQYYVGVFTEDTPRSTAMGAGVDERPERLTIFRGIAQRVPGFQLSDPVEVRDLDIRRLPTYHRQLVEATISAENLDDARQIVAELERVAAFCRPENDPAADEQPTDQPTAQPTDGPTRPTDEPTGTPENEPGSNGRAAPTTPPATGPTAEPTSGAPEVGTSNGDTGPALDAETGLSGLNDSDHSLAAGVDDIPLNCGGVEPDPSETR